MLPAESAERQADGESTAGPGRQVCAAVERLEALLGVRAATRSDEERTGQLADGPRGQPSIRAPLRASQQAVSCLRRAAQGRAEGVLAEAAVR